MASDASFPVDNVPAAGGMSHAALRDAIAGRRGRIVTGWMFTGPAVVASIAYIDPGNFATNIQAGAKYGYTLLWVVLSANLIAMLFQALSAKLGIVTGRNLAELARERFPWPLALVMWIVSEIAAIATDLAEFLGGAIGFSLLFGMSLLTGMAATAVITYGILMFNGERFRRIELVVGLFVAVIGVCYVVELFIAPVNWGGAMAGLVTPQIADADALLIAVGIVGATVMPHAIYLHSALTQSRGVLNSDAERERVLRFSNREVIIALALAGVVNMAMVIMAAAAFNAGNPEVAEIETAYHMLTPLLGGAAATAFLISLLASGVSSSVVGTMAGQVIMQGFFRRRIPIWLRRLVTMVPAFAIVAMGVGATQALVMSQVVLSLALPFPMIALIVLSSDRALMGRFANGRLTKIAALVGAAVILVLNAVLLYHTAFGG
ncbi:Mn2+/Fe2+ transporter, NRAMP family [Rhodomicrobium vannielii ATCC 17100]|uniref:Divalent metal cation transporter MntH n=1 Tax=Rhodomicrobium vannielii (strain ATCC 17100 / DSM 162 / LMG 4299 / NCIMB 10020 / ATH 3.1.1) TaxID=648757 RepID=E3I8C4_RHOVT|nr:Nramp family divalent metal transporter [Rhodomicrobium vannielii]ADP69749.1 Mn2+/Fe2+ transporter, NRAMP family [Rhodomicrobium vannielii ATCC 17100]